MAFQAVPDVAEIGIIYTLNGVIVQNVLYAELPNGYVLADLEALASQVDDQVQGTWKSQQAPEAIYVKTEVRGLAFLNDQTTENNDNAGAGGHTGSAMPNQVTFAVKKTSGQTGRSARGRLYWIGIPDDEITAANENFIESAYADDVVSAVDSQRTGIAAVGLWEPVLVSRFSEGEVRAVGVTFPWTATVRVDSRLDTQRGRLP